MKIKHLGSSVFLLLAILLIANDLRLTMASLKDYRPSVLWIPIAYAAASFTLYALLFNSQKHIRNVGLVLLCSSVFTDLVYLILGGFPFSYADALHLFNNTDYASNTFLTFGKAFLMAFLGTGIFFVLFWKSTRHLPFSFTLYWILVVLFVEILCVIFSGPFPGLTDFLPSVYRISGAPLTAAFSHPESMWKREEVRQVPDEKIARHLFLIVDESVAGTALSINGNVAPTTPFLDRNSKTFLNFGKAASFTNYSAGSNFALVSGLRMEELPDEHFRSFTRPSLFQYAKKAGYTTWLLDAQSEGSDLQNYMTCHDLQFIDSIFKPANLPSKPETSMRDHVLADKIVAITRSSTPSFVYVNKSGAHFPYFTNFPEDSLKHMFGQRDYSTTTKEYYKAVYWNVDKFWERILPEAEIKGVLMVYTSDHGENFDSPSFQLKHASVYRTEKEEGVVPLLVLDGAHLFPPDFKPAPPYSHASIFPTLLQAMGYKKNFILKNYGKGLDEKPAHTPRYVFTGDIFGRGTNKRVKVEE